MQGGNCWDTSRWAGTSLIAGVWRNSFIKAQKMEAVGVLAGDVAHAFNNLLTGMLGYTSLLLKRWSSDEKTTTDLKQIRNLANRGAGLTRQLLAFSRQQPLSPTVVHLNDLIQNILSMLGRLIGEDIELTYECKADPDCIRADHSQIEQVLMNLAVNAREAMPHGGSLTIRTAKAALSEGAANADPHISPGRYVVLTVSDSGEGMDKPTLQHFLSLSLRQRPWAKGPAWVYQPLMGSCESTPATLRLKALRERAPPSRFTFLPQKRRQPRTRKSPCRSPFPPRLWQRKRANYSIPVKQFLSLAKGEAGALAPPQFRSRLPVQAPA